MSYPHDRPAQEPGGMECMECGVIFVGSEAHSFCAICANNGWFPMAVAPKDGRTVVLLAIKDDNDEWINIEGWYEPGIADRQWYDIYHGPIDPKFWRPRHKPPVQP
ncbi:MAG: hypothetical protein EOS65_02425 [Mesorhizobium sp.]|uniref:hypothetical protein n=1 Tax=Mesorhizobium sp. TaxID=1871066 RepID=UPI000FE47EF5|nr:hypothetical protein [Mesorhizobium sp.]RWF44251.1 MAG: hypothetical protein EOS65_02425 [Mesorhizobium sp.]